MPDVTSQGEQVRGTPQCGTEQLTRALHQRMPILCHSRMGEHQAMGCFLVKCHGSWGREILCVWRKWPMLTVGDLGEGVYGHFLYCYFCNFSVSLKLFPISK